MLRGSWNSQILGVGVERYCNPAKSVFVWTVGCGAQGFHSISVSSHIQFSFFIRKSELKSNSAAATYQRAVVEQSCGSVIGQAERQDMPLPGAQGHFIF